MRVACHACKFPHVTDDGLVSFSVEWHQAHMWQHRSMFPNLDRQSVDNLQDRIEAKQEGP